MSDPGTAAEAADPADETRTISVLYVEDNQQTGPLVREWLERHDARFEVALAVTLDDAADRLAEESFDAVVADYRFPGGKGLDLVPTVRNLTDDAPFLLYSARVNDEVTQEADDAGVTAVVEKGGSDQLSKLAVHIVEAIERQRESPTAAEATPGDDWLEAFADELVHELRGPLSVALGHLDMLEADEERTEQIRASLEEIDEVLGDLPDRAAAFEEQSEAGDD